MGRCLSSSNGFLPKSSPLKIAGWAGNGYGKAIAPQLTFCTLCYVFFWTNRLAESQVASERLLRAQLEVGNLHPTGSLAHPFVINRNHKEKTHTHTTPKKENPTTSTVCLFLLEDRQSFFTSLPCRSHEFVTDYSHLFSMCPASCRRVQVP